MSELKRTDFSDPDLFADVDDFSVLANVARDNLRADDTYAPVLTYDAVRDVSKDNRTFSSQEKTILVATPVGADLIAQRNFLLNMDDPRHSRMRKIVAEAFSVRAIEARLPEIERIVGRRTQALVTGEAFEFVDAYATPVTLGVILMIMGLGEEDMDLIRRCTEEVVYTEDSRFCPTQQVGRAAAAALFTYAMQLRANAEAADASSVLRSLTDGVDGDRLSEDEFCFFFVFILAAGYETTRSMLCNMMSILSENAQILPMLRQDPSCAMQVVEEMLRLDPPVIQMCRTAMADTRIGGQSISRGCKLGLLYPMANRDERIFERPHAFRSDRENAARHLSFGIGRHTCLGAHLARLEIACVLRALAARFTTAEVITRDRVRSSFTRSTAKMTVRFSNHVKEETRSGY